jgi:hypothetical protein
MSRVQRTVVGAAMALALVIGSVTTAYVGASGGPNCLTAPCPPPENRLGADTDVAYRAGGLQDDLRVAGGPNCLTGVPCPPPKN